MFEALKKSVFGILSYIIVCGIIFLISFSFATKKFPPDMKQIRGGLDSIAKLPDALGVIQKQQEELLKIDFVSIPTQLNSTSDLVNNLNQKMAIFETQNNYLIQKISNLEQNNINLLQRIESLERSKHNH
jgi:hypothetical protein